MTAAPELADVALAFCKECLGWEDARPSTPHSTLIVSDGKLEPAFDYRSLNAVMEAVERFCTRNDLFISCCRAPGLKTWQVNLFNHDLETTLGIEFASLGHALLSACVEASRKLKDAT